MFIVYAPGTGELLTLNDDSTIEWRPDLCVTALFDTEETAAAALTLCAERGMIFPASPRWLAANLLVGCLNDLDESWGVGGPGLPSYYSAKQIAAQADAVDAFYDSIALDFGLTLPELHEAQRWYEEGA